MPNQTQQEIDEQNKRFDAAWQKVIEFFPDALLIARVQGGMTWRFSNPEWAHGACARMAAMVLASDCTGRLRRDEQSS